MKHVQQIEIIIQNIETLNLEKIKLLNEYEEREKRNDTQVKIFLFWAGVILFICSYIGLSLSLSKTLLLVIFLTPLAIPFQMFIRFLKEKTNNRDGFLTTKDLNRHIILMDQDIKSEEKELFQKLSIHINRVTNQINKYKTHSSKILNYYIHCQYLQISELFISIAKSYERKTNRKVPFEYSEVQYNFRSFKICFARIFYPNLKLIEIR